MIKEEIREYNKKWKKENEEKVKEYNREYGRKWRKENKEKVKEYNKQYHKKFYNPYKLNKDGIPKYLADGRKRSKYNNNIFYSLDYKTKERIGMGKLTTAIPKSQLNNKSSKRKGVSYNKRHNKWVGYLQKDGIRYMKMFSTYEEAVAYREYLEDEYFNDRQKQIKEYFKNISE